MQTNYEKPIQKGGNFPERFYAFSYRTILAVVLFCTVFICMGTISLAHNVLFEKLFSSAVRLLFPFLLTGLLCLLIVVLFHCFRRFSRRQLLISSAVLFLFIASVFAVILCNFRPTPYSDSLNVLDGAMYFAKTGDRPLSPDSSHAAYFGRYGNNYFITLVFSLLFRLLERLGIQDITLPLLLLTTGGIMAATVFLYLIGVRTAGLRGGVRILTLCALNPTYYLLSLWVYTNVLSVPFMAAVLYFGICIYQEQRRGRRILFCALEAIMAVIGGFVRPTVLIPLIALILCALLWGIREKQNFRRLLSCALLCLLVAAPLFHLISRWNDSYFHTVSDQNYPATHWIMLGSHGSGEYNKADVKYTAGFETKAEKTQANLQKIAENYSQYGITDLAAFLHRKLLLSWSIGDNGELFSKASQDKKLTGLYPWVLGKRRDLLRSYFYAFRITTCILMLAGLGHLLGKKEKDKYQFLFVLSLLGGILFYSFWEVKGSYSAPFLTVMLLIAAHGGNVLDDMLIRHFRVAGDGRNLPVHLTALACVLSVCCLIYQGLSHTLVTHQLWSVRSCSEASQQFIKNTEEEFLIEQTFFAEKPFQTIQIRAGADETAKEANSGFALTLTDEAGQTLYSSQFFADQLPKDENFRVPVGEIVPAGRQSYTLKLTSIPGSQGTFQFRERTNSYIDLYDGTLSVNGTARMNDLWLQVYKEYEAPWCSKRAAVLICGGLFALALSLYAGLLHIKKTIRG